MFKNLIGSIVILLITIQPLFCQNSVVAQENNTAFINASLKSPSHLKVESDQDSPKSVYPTGNALDFDGVDQYVDCGIIDLSGTSLSFECWVNADQFQSTHPYISSVMGAELKTNTDGNSALLRLGDDGLDNDLAQFVLSIGGDQVRLNGTTHLSANTWYHLAAVYSGTEMRLYVNGVLEASKSQSGAFVSNTAFYLSRSYGARYLDGSIDEVRVWRDARTISEIRENMCQTLVGNEAGLIAYYSCNSTSGTTLYDRSSNSYNGTLVNAPSWPISTAFNMWLGGTNNEWNTASNWGLGSVPNSTSSNVGITDQFSTALPEINGAITLNNLVISGARGLTVLPDMSLTTNNFFNFGSCEVTSEQAGTGSVIVEANSAGDISVERFLTHDRWHYISGQTDISENFGSLNMGLGTPGSSSNNFYRWEEDHNSGGITGYWVDILNGSDGSGTNSLLDSEGFTPCKGYAISYANSDKTLIFSGEPFLTNQSILLQKSAGSNTEASNLVGNPFTSTLAINTGADNSNNFLTQNATILDANFVAVYVWDESAGWDGISNSDYDTYNNASGAFFADPGQAFMVMAKTDNTLLTFYESARKHGASDFYKSNSDQTRYSVKLRVSDNETLSNSTEVVFLPGMTNGLDPSYDAGKFKGNPNISLYTQLVNGSGNDFAIQALSDEELESYLIPVGIDVAEEGLFTFSINQENLDNYNILLEDRLMNTVTNLRWETYSTTIEESGVGRFYLQLKDATSVENQAVDSEIGVYVSEGNLCIKGSGKGQVKVLDAAGRVVMIRSIGDANLSTIPLYLNSGLYVIRVDGENGIKTQKVVI